ncbi:hypothetical protein MOK15_07810 [Sphingobium sp. BYY-5]|uniref:hypothetical protein n=1 Tax=Sphingobium sp. BYY-5 TaxID=2926400 RepID=UPI001FA7A9A3|nr:hypothetical protein [Sphingobium sp. BYY-5]MCI4589997.1 hypothetical protein [Sphingobium sp. BYY-5]
MLDRADEAGWRARSGICGEASREAELAALDRRYQDLERALVRRSGEQAGFIRLDGPGSCAEADHYERHVLRYRNALRDAEQSLGED